VKRNDDSTKKQKMGDKVFRAEEAATHEKSVTLRCYDAGCDAIAAL